MAAIDAKAHLEQARHNYRLLQDLDRDEYPDWVVTVAFYTVLHLVTAYLARSQKRELRSHQARETAIFLDPTLRPHLRDYTRLAGEAHLARYTANMAKVRSNLPVTLAAFERLSKGLCRYLNIPPLQPPLSLLVLPVPAGLGHAIGPGVVVFWYGRQRSGAPTGPCCGPWYNGLGGKP